MKFNIPKRNIPPLSNHEGARAFALDPAMELYTAVVTWSLNDSFYEKNDGRVIRIRKLIAQNDPMFVARLAVYARHKMNMRSVPLVLVVELARIHSGNDLISKLTHKVIARADEITEMLACYQLLNKRKGTKKLNRLSKQLQKGLSLAFNNFDGYQFAKYNRDSEVTLRDALFIVHPKARDDAQQRLFNQIADNSLEKPYTWETELSALGQIKFDNDGIKAAAFKSKWEELIDSNKLGYMALLRNLRNIIEAKVSYPHMQKVFAIIASAERVASARQFPFRYLAAYRELYHHKFRAGPADLIEKPKSVVDDCGYKVELLDTLEEAMVHSSATIAGFDSETKVLLACDVSGSMQVPVSKTSKIQLFDVGLTLAMMLHFRCKNVQVGMFGDIWKTIAVPKSRILANVNEFYRREGEVGYATNGHLVIRDLLDRKISMDKVMLFTDCQLWNNSGDGENINSLWAKYKRSISPNAKLYLFDLKGYGKTPLQLKLNDVYLLAGWSDKIFSVLDALENGKKSLDEIDAIVI